MNVGLYRESKKGERKSRNEREDGESKDERESCAGVRSVRCGRVDLDLKLYSPLSLPVPTSLLLLLDAFKPSSYPYHHTQPCSPPLLPVPAYPPLTPSIPGGTAA